MAPGTVDVVAPAPAQPPVRFRPAACESLLGYALPGAEQAGILRRLGCEVDESGEEAATPASPSAWTVTPPSFRADLEREVDLIEEVGRIAGYGQAPETLPAHRTSGGLTGPQKVARAVRRALAGCGLDEAITYTFVAPDAVAPLALPEGDVRLCAGEDQQPHERGAVGDAHHAAAGPAGRGARQRGAPQRPAQPVRAGARVPVGRQGGAGAGARRRARRRAAA